LILNPLNFGQQGAPPLLWNLDKGLPLTTGQWNLDGGFAVNDAAPSTPEVESWAISENREALTKLLENGIELQAVSANGMMGASRNNEPRNQQHIQLIDLKTGDVRKTLDVTFEDVLAMALSPDARYLAVHSSNRRFVTVWDTTSGKELTEITRQNTNYASGVGHMAFSPNGKWLAVQYDHDEVDLFSTATWKPTVSVKMEFRSLLHGQLAFSPDSKVLAIAGQSVRFINVDSGESIGAVCSPSL
jgi:WD40 repeat protein